MELEDVQERKKPKQLTKEQKIAQIFDIICGVAIQVREDAKTLEMAHLCPAVLAT